MASLKAWRGHWLTAYQWSGFLFWIPAWTSFLREPPALGSAGFLDFPSPSVPFSFVKSLQRVRSGTERTLTAHTRLFSFQSCSVCDYVMWGTAGCDRDSIDGESAIARPGCVISLGSQENMWTKYIVFHPQEVGEYNQRSVMISLPLVYWWRKGCLPVSCSSFVEPSFFSQEGAKSLVSFCCSRNFLTFHAVPPSCCFDLQWLL